MTKRYLIYITLGPVQDFIAQARRTRDLWYGSHVLSELSRTVARILAAANAKLIFPAIPPNDPGRELEECRAPFRPQGHPKGGAAPLAVANIVIASVSGTEAEVRRLAESAREEAKKQLDALAGEVKKRCAGLIAPGTEDAWNEQIDSLLDFTAGWTEMSDGYAKARARVTKEVGARKNLRDFEPWAAQRGGVPKSSLDGARETVLARPEERAPFLVRKYRLTDGEQLDAIGLLKRSGGETKESRDQHHLQFVPIVNVALAPWLKAAGQYAPSEFGAVLQAATNWHKGNDRRSGDNRLDYIPREDVPTARIFPHDASIFLPNRWWPTCKEQGIMAPAAIDSLPPGRKPDPELLGQWRELVEDWGRRTVSPIYQTMEEPSPYVACIVADGDRMGSAIDLLLDEDANRQFSARLAEFAQQARDIVEGKHLGSLVFAGGDDVLAFLPVSTAAACADELRLAFAKLMETYGAPGKPPTLSVGIGIGHVLEAMGDLLQLGREAEKTAKGSALPEDKQRNALAIIVDKRSGGRREFREQWHASTTANLKNDANLLSSRRLSTRKVYEIADILSRLPSPNPNAVSVEGFSGVLHGEITRSLSRVDGGSKLKPKDVSLDLDPSADYATMRKVVASWVDRMLIARAIADAEPRVRA